MTIIYSKTKTPSLSTPLNDGGLIRAERTPGAVAVSAYTMGSQGDLLPPGNLQNPQLSHAVIIAQTSPKQLRKTPYRDSLAKRSFFDDEEEYLLNKLTTKCPGYWIPGFDDTGNRYAMELFCGREWCPVCGKKNSKMHLRRFARLLPRAMQMPKIGYFVIEWELASRHKLRNKKAISRIGIKIRKEFKAMGYNRGLSRWHWFGEKTNKYNPHLNVLVDGMFIPDSRLEGIKSRLKSLLNEPNLIVNYSYRKSPGEMVHTLKYITRPTFLDAHWDIPIALELRGFRNQSWWGSGNWSGELVWSLEDLTGEAKKEVINMDYKAIESLQAGISPKTGGKITWGKALPIGILDNIPKRDLGAGYYELEPVRPPPGLSGDVLARLHTLRLVNEAILRVKEKEWLDNRLYEYEMNNIADEAMFKELGVKSHLKPSSVGNDKLEASQLGLNEGVKWT